MSFRLKNFISTFFFLVFLLGYQFLYKRKVTRVVYFTIFSLYFFYKACGWYVGFIMLSAIVDFNLANWLHDAKSKTKKKAILIFSIIIKLGLLVYFNYTDFFYADTYLINPRKLS